jgi:predicted RecB family nuclease
VKLRHVKGVGPSAEEKLEASDIATVEELANVDLRSHDVDGLSAENVAQLRDNAKRFLQAQDERGDLTLVEGLGPSAEDKLEAAGVETIEDLAELDLRSADVDGLSTDHVQKLKRNARYLLPA